MASVLTCPACGVVQETLPEQAGQWLVCGHCGRSLPVPGAPAEAPPPLPIARPVDGAVVPTTAVAEAPGGAVHMAQVVALAYATRPSGTGKAVAALVLGIVSIPTVVFYGIPSLVCGILATVFGVQARRMIARGQMPAHAGGQAKAGLICGVVGIALSVLFWAFIVGLGIYFFSRASSMAMAPPPMAYPSMVTPRTPSPGETGEGVPTGLIICDDGVRVPVGMGQPFLRDGEGRAYGFRVDGHGVGYAEYRCSATGRTWAYGKDEQFTSPFVEAEEEEPEYFQP